MSSAHVLSPSNQDEMVVCVRAALGDDVPLVITGGATRPPHASPEARVVSTRRLDRIVAHEAGDLTLTAECGLTIAVAQSALGKHRQFVALNADDDAAATIGGVIASGRDGALAPRFGSVRDQLLGITVVNGDGRVTHAGGRVVKNVTGYDLCRLYAGSRGGLGIILEMTLRVRPRPESAKRIRVSCDGTSAALARAAAIRDAVPEAASIQVVGGAGGSAVLHVIVAGLPAFVEASAAEVRRAAGAGAIAEDECDPTDFRVAPRTGKEAASTTRPGILQAGRAHAVIEITALPATWRTLEAEVAPLLTPPLSVVHDVLRGVRTSWHEDDASPFLFPSRLDATLARAGAVLDVPSDAQFPAWLARLFPGQVPSGLALMQLLKSKLDPRRILNRGLGVYG